MKKIMSGSTNKKTVGLISKLLTITYYYSTLHKDSVIVSKTSKSSSLTGSAWVSWC